MKTLTRLALVPVVTIATAAPALAQEAPDAVATQLSAASITGYLTSAQGLIVAAVIMLVSFVFLRKAFGK